MNTVVANRQRTKKINTRAIKHIVKDVFAELGVVEAELGVNLVADREMTLVNETFLQHVGSTDVITFDHTNRKRNRLKRHTKIHGELFVCVDVAISQAREFDTTWQSEMVRYVIHGILHLLGYDDLKPHLRREMKREENRLMRVMAKRFSFAELSRTAKIRV